jgi:hypothetical protein
MRNNIYKLVAFAIGISVMSGSIVPAFAADTTTQNTSTTTSVQSQTMGKPILTLDDAIKTAISNSETLALDEQKISYQDKINNVNEKLDDFSVDSNTISDENKKLDSDTADITLNQLKQQRDFDEDKLIQKTTKAYNDIVTSQMKIDKEAKDLEIKNKELNNTKLKNSLGVVITTDLTATQIQIESLQNAQKSSQNALKDAQYSFKVLTGKDVTQYSLEKDIKYDVFKIDGSVDEYLDNAIDNYLKYKTQLIQLNKDYYTDNSNSITVTSAPDPKKYEISDLTNDAINSYKDEMTTAKNGIVKEDDIDTNLADYEKYLDSMNTYTNATETYAEALAARLIYLNTKIGTYESETALNEAKKTYKESLRSLYTNLLTAEDSINTLKKQIELNNKQLSNAKLKCDLGLLTKSDYNTQVVSSEDFELQLRSLIDSYNTLKEDIQKPWIAFS